MKGRNLNVATSVRVLSKKNDCRISGTSITVLANGHKKKSNDLGNKSWGRIDYLKSQGYSLFFES